ncbi:MAG: hypothetical protein M0C28_47815 [Candidatus Moduliflexus flocculans]|nr:hypothetical protein [Candidatus Moduliflexus flocculans]
MNAQSATEHLRQGDRRLGGQPARGLHPLRPLRLGLPFLPGDRITSNMPRSGRSSRSGGPTSSASRRPEG